MGRWDRGLHFGSSDRPIGTGDVMQAIFAKFEKLRVMVIGDVMIDSYLLGKVDRISPEAPVPVIKRAEERHVAGGAANVAANAASLGAEVYIVGATGEDRERSELLALLAAHGSVRTEGLIAVAGRATTKKIRLIAQTQQIARIDHEDTVPLPTEVQARLAATALDLLDKVSCVLMSDYNKGVIQPGLARAIIDKARRIGVPVIVDPKQLDFSVYAGASVIKPNRKELNEATGHPTETDSEAFEAARVVHRLCGADVLLTRSEKGMSYFPTQGTPVHLPTFAQSVYDVSGAGDTVLATFGLCLAAGLGVVDCMRTANFAAGIVVGHLGTAVITKGELALAVSMHETVPPVEDGRLLSLEEAKEVRARWAAQKLTVGFTNGCFDLLHPGHVSLLRQAADACDRLIVALNTDLSVSTLKGPTRPIQNERNRATVIGALKGVAATVLFSEETPLELIRALQPDVLIKGADYTLDKVVGADVVLQRGGRVILADLVDGQSTTNLVGRMKAN